MYAELHSIPLTTDADGTATGYSIPITGRIISVRYVKTDFADGVDFAITLENTGETVLAVDNLNASATYAPRQAIHTTAGAAALYAAVGQAVLDHIVAADDRVKVAVANGGDTKAGKIIITVA